jgi:hypothetical protein
MAGGPAGGVIETVLFRGPSATQRLYVNTDASAAGGLQAELLDASGVGLSANDVVVGTDSTRHKLGFVDEKGAALDLPGKPLRLRFTLAAGVHLYSYWVE